MVSPEATLLVFGVSLLVGGFAISVGATFALKSEGYSHAVLTAVLGAIAWAVVNVVFEAAGLQGAFSSLVGLVVWVWVIRRRYEVGWFRGGVIGLPGSPRCLSSRCSRCSVSAVSTPTGSRAREGDDLPTRDGGVQISD